MYKRQGFHSLVSSGTASKQIKNEKNMLPVSFGAMLMESMLAILALIAVAVSYTHLDVYKRQLKDISINIADHILRIRVIREICTP